MCPYLYSPCRQYNIGTSISGGRNKAEGERGRGNIFLRGTEMVIKARDEGRKGVFLALYFCVNARQQLAMSCKLPAISEITHF